jgi:hypothetical protein
LHRKLSSIKVSEIHEKTIEFVGIDHGGPAWFGENRVQPGATASVITNSSFRGISTLANP